MERTLTQLRVLSAYIGWSVWPLPSSMHFYYDNYVASRAGYSLQQLWRVAFSCYRCWGVRLPPGNAARCSRWESAGFSWRICYQRPIPLELAFEHRNYPALFGVLLARPIWFG